MFLRDSSLEDSPITTRLSPLISLFSLFIMSRAASCLFSLSERVPPSAASSLRISSKSLCSRSRLCFWVSSSLLQLISCLVSSDLRMFTCSRSVTFFWSLAFICPLSLRLSITSSLQFSTVSSNSFMPSFKFFTCASTSLQSALMSSRRSVSLKRSDIRRFFSSS